MGKVFYFYSMKFIIILLLPLIYSCQNNSGAVNTKDSLPTAISTADTIPNEDLAGNFSPPTLLTFDSSSIPLFLSRYPLFKKYQDDYYRFYSTRKFSYAWHQADKLPIEQSSILYNLVYNIDANGLPIDIPYADEYTKLMEDPSADSILTRELMITGQYLVYARKVLTGISESDSRSTDWFIPRKKVEYASLLDSLLSGSNTVLDKLVFPQYYLLRDKLKALYDVEKSGRWIVLKAERNKYKLGDSSPAIRQIRQKLFFSGDISNDNESAVFDSTLYEGVREFQRRYGLQQDGVASPGVLKEMSAPLSKRMEQVMVNMERCRWVENVTDEKYLVVNIPQFQLLAYKSKTLEWTCPVVVGKTTNKTVIFKGDMKFVVFSPYWNVPPSIINKEILPGMKRNKNYLAKHNMEWNNGRVRQKPGPQNSLGLVKFLFPNSFNIYLHDTPSKSLFKEDKRAFSHGCIRVSEPKKLASWLLQDDPRWTPEKMTEAMNSGKEQYVTLKKTVPVYLVYFTAFVDSQGKLNFREDIYNRDNKLKEMIFEKNGSKSAQ
jgi:murein L,D-transpeptidase YcbB/YkuD